MTPYEDDLDVVTAAVNRVLPPEKALEIGDSQSVWMTKFRVAIITLEQRALYFESLYKERKHATERSGRTLPPLPK